MADDSIQQQFSIDASQALRAMEALNSAYAKHEQAIQSLAATMAKFNGSSNAIANAAASGARSLNQYAQSSKTLRGSFDDLISAHGRWTTSVSLASRIIFTQAVIIGFRQARMAIEDAMQASIAFQKQLSEIKSIDSDKIFGADLGDKLRGVSTQFNIPLPDVAKGAYEALSAQVLKTGNDFQFMTTAAQFSKGTLSSMDASVKGLAGGLNAYGQSTANADRLASQFNETIRLGTIRGEELANNFGTIATLGHQLGVSQAELLAAVAALTNAGVPQAQAFTQIRASLSGLAKPTEDLTKLFKANGIANAEQLVAMKGYGGALKFLLEQTDGTTAGAAKLFQNQRALLGVLSLGGQGAKTYADDLKAIDGVMSSLNAERAQQVMASDAEQLTAKWNTLKNSLIPLGDGMVTVSNTGIDTLAVFRDFAAATLEFTGDLLRAKPALDQFGDAWRNLQGLFGKDLTIGESGGKIVSELEIRKRQLDSFAKRHAEDEKAESARLEQLATERNKIKFRELDNFKSINQALQTEAETAANRLVETEKKKNAELARQIQQAHDLIKQAPGRIADVQNKRSQVDFEARTEDLPGGQKALAEIQRANELAAAAQAAMIKGAQTGNQALIEQGRSAFQAADAQAAEAKSTATSANEKDRARQATFALKGILDQQESAERRIAQIAQARIPTLEQEKAKRQQSLDLIEKATKDLIKNASLFDKQGNKLPADQLQKQAEARKRAFATLEDQGVSKDKIVDLQFRTDTSLQKLSGDIESAMAKIDASPFETAAIAIRGSVGPANAMADAMERAARASGQINFGATPSPAPSAGSPDGFASGGIVPGFAAGGIVPQYLASGGSAFQSLAAKGTDTALIAATPGEYIVNRDSSAKFYSQLQSINAGRDPKPASPQIDNSDHSIGDVSFNISGAQGPQATAREVIQMIRREQRRGSGNSLR